MHDIRIALVEAQIWVRAERWRLRALRVSVALARPARLQRKYDPDQPRDDRGRWVETGAGEDEDDIPTGTVTVVQRARTGNRFIDSYTEILERKLVEVMERVGAGSGPAFGVKVHSEFATAIRDAALPGVRVEQSWLSGFPMFGNPLDSVRTDLVLHERRDATGDVVAIWDLKTGSAALGPSRVDQIRREVGVASDVPVIELHAIRGTTIKSRILRGA